MLSHVALAPSDAGFAAFVDDLAFDLAAVSPTFEAFVQGMPGVLPSEALASLRRMNGLNASRLVADASIDRAPITLDQGRLLPLPHPLDSEFRFDAETARILARWLLEATREGDEILLIGVPSVAIELSSTGADRRFRYLGPDNCVTEAVRNAISDGRLALDQGVGGTAAACLLDPPWYVDPMRDLLRVSAFGCKPGAAVGLVMPPIGARPEIVADRETFIDYAAAAGLAPNGAGGPVYYRTPLFELAALERQGIARLSCWRRGDFMEFRSTSPGIARAAWAPPRACELTVDGLRFRVTDGVGNGPDELLPIGDHEIFDSVSARAPGRELATLWTTTNRAFAVDRQLARTVLGAWRSDMSPVLPAGRSGNWSDGSVKSSIAAIERLIHQVGELIDRELLDARRLVGDDAWTKTATAWRF